MNQKKLTNDNLHMFFNVRVIKCPVSFRDFMLAWWHARDFQPNYARKNATFLYHCAIIFGEGISASFTRFFDPKNYFKQKSPYTKYVHSSNEEHLLANKFRHRKFYTQALLHGETFMQSSFYADVWNREILAQTKALSRTQISTRRAFYTGKSLHRQRRSRHTHPQKTRNGSLIGSVGDWIPCMKSQIR